MSVHSGASASVPVAADGQVAGQRLMIKPFTVEVSGWPAMTYYAATRGQALAKVWGDYQSLEDISFKAFLGIVRAKKGAGHPRFGEPILVGGQPAFFIGYDGQYVQFARAGSHVVLNSHPADVTGNPSTPAAGTEPSSGGVNQ